MEMYRLLLIGTIAFFCGLRPLPAAPGARWVRLQGVPAAVAIDPWSGVMAAVDADGTVRAYANIAGGDDQLAAQAKVGGNVMALEHKRFGRKSCFAIASRDEQAISVLDAATLETLRKFPISMPVRSVAAAGDPSVPHIYYIAGRRHSENILGRIDIATMANEIMAGFDGEAERIAVSAQGHYLYGTRTSTTPPGQYVYELPVGPDSSATVMRIQYVHHDPGSFMPDPLGEYLAVDNSLLTVDWGDTRGTLQSRPAAFFVDRPLIVGSAGSEVYIISRNSLKALAQVSIPMLPRELNLSQPAHALPRDRALGPPNRLLADSRHGAVLFWLNHAVAVWPLDDLNLPQEPLLRVVPDGPAALTVGLPAKITLARQDPRIAVELAAGPAGMKLDGGQLVWTPDGNSVGPCRVQLRLSAAGLHRTQDLTLAVQRRGVPLPFGVRRMAVSPNARHAVLLARSDQEPELRARPGRLAIVDLQTLKVIAQRELAFAISPQAVAIDNDAVYVASSYADVVYSLSLKDLSDAKRTFTASRVNRLVAAGGMLFGQTGDAAAPVIAWRIPALEPVQLPGEPVPRLHSGDGVLPIVVGESWYFRGAVFGPGMEPAQLLVIPGDLPVLSLPPPRGANTAVRGRLAGPWNTLLEQASIRRPGGQGIGRLSGIAHVLLHDRPIAVSLVPEFDASGVRWSLVACEAVTGTEVDRVVLSREPRRDDFDDPPGSASQRLAVAGDRLVAVTGGSLFCLKVSDLCKGDYGTPLHFRIPERVPLISDGPPVTLRPAIAGGTAPVAFSLDSQAPGLEIDPATGAVTIDPAALLDRAVAAALNSLGRHLAGPLPREERLAAIVEQAAARGQRLTGRPPRGMPVAVPVTIIATDREHQRAELPMHVILDVPLPLIRRELPGQPQTRPAEK